MATPKSAHHTSDAADTPDTTIPSVFDGSDSSLSSTQSLSSEYLEEYDSPIKIAQPNVDPTDQIQDVTAWTNPDLYGTAASQWTQRARTKTVIFPGLAQLPEDVFNEEPDTSETSDLAPTTALEDIEKSPAPAEKEVQPQQQTTKRKRQASTSDVTDEPPKKKVRGAVASKRGRSKAGHETTVQDVPIPPAPAPSRPSRKRKSTSPVPAEAKTPPAKKANTATPRPATPAPTKSKSKSKAGTPAAKTPVRKSGRAVRAPARLGQPTGGRYEEVPVQSRSILRLKMYKGWAGERERPSSATSNADATPDTNPSHENPSFESPGKQLTFESQEQYAQRAWTPIPASNPSQPSSSEHSQVAAPTSQIQAAKPAFEGLEAPEHVLTQDSQADVEIPPHPFASDVTVESQPQPPQQHSSPVQNDVVMTETDLQGSFSTLSFRSTQPTLILDEPWNPIAAKVVPMQTVSTKEDSDVDSGSTTEDEGEVIMPQPHALLSDDQQLLHDISNRLFANRSPGTTQPAPAGRPEVWADGRQELCETLHYFRSYQSACYSTGGFVRAFMFDKVAHARDYMDSDVVISRAGGGLAKDNDSGEMKTNKDQKEDTPIVQALNNCMKHFNPLVIITGVDNPHILSQPPHQYCVLDYFKPTHIWFERSGKSKITRYRFEKLNMQKESWWRPENEETVVELGALEPPNEQTCRSCKKSSTQIYLNGWMCLQPSCESFWRIIRDSTLGSHTISHEPDEASLIYDPRFLKQKTPWPNDDTEYHLAFNAPETSTHAIAGENTSQAFWSGIVCPECGKCNSRLGWTGWECSNPQCDFRKESPHSLIPAVALHDPFWPLTDSYTMSRDWQSPLIDVSVSFAHGYRINKYTLPGLDNCFITHMIANKTVLEEPGGPDAMFEELQQTDIGLRRREMPNGQLKGASYCRHFAVNYGMPYKFIAGTASHSFDTAARPITATRSRLNWAARYLLGASHKDDEEFNEVLALGYFEAQKINYHDDGESGLGPTIATLSLGAPGTMRIRMKARHFHGCSSANVYDASPPLPGCQSYTERVALHASLSSLKTSDPKAYRARLKEIPKELGLRASGNAKDVLRMELGHGDVVVMHGAEVQRYYEHAVEHAGKLRFAVTCRFIDGGSLGKGDAPGYVVERDSGGYGGGKMSS